MKKVNLFYWIVTILFSALMVLGGIFDLAQAPDAVKLIRHLGYPAYFVPFIGVMKILGILAVLIPGFPKVKEWAYAGLAFDIGGALFSHLSSGDGPDIWMSALIAFLLGTGSYILYHRRKNLLETLSLR